ncbi:MAG: TY-Chap domain-containing protein [Janthinobacterium lividum]
MGKMMRVPVSIVALAFALVTVAVRAQTSPPEIPSVPISRAPAVAALSKMMTVHRSGRDGLALLADGNKYLQCRRMADRTLRCEAAGTVMQPSLRRVLTAARVAKLTDLGWVLDPSFGNYVRAFPAGTSAEQVADAASEALRDGYDVDLDRVDVRTTWVRKEACPPRNGPGQNLAGVIDGAPIMRPTAVHACAYTLPPTKVAQSPVNSAEELIDRYGAEVTGELGRLRVEKDRRGFAVFDTDVGYVQCRPRPELDILDCEAASADSWPVLASVLTPERLDHLHEAGFSDPGRTPNYEKRYPLAAGQDASVAQEILTVLYKAYGYDGARALRVLTK